MSRVRVDLSVRLLGPLHVGSGLTAAGYADRLVLRDARGLPYIPGTSLKGAARDATSRIAGLLGQPPCGNPCRQEPPCIRCALFGSTVREGGLRFGDLRYPAPETGGGADEDDGDDAAARRFAPEWFTVRNGVQICRRRRVAQERHKYLLEFASTAPDASLTGRITGTVPDVPDWAEVYRELLSQPALPPLLWVLLCGLQLTDRFGGARSRGAGAAAVDITRIVVDGEDVSQGWTRSLAPDAYGAEGYLEALEQWKGSRA